MSAVLYVQKRSLKQHNPILKHDKLNPLDVFSFQDNLPQKKTLVWKILHLIICYFNPNICYY